MPKTQKERIKMARTQAWEEMEVGTQEGSRYGNKDFKDFRLKLSASPEGSRYRVRFLDKFVRYMAHYPEKKDVKSGKRIEISFPDAEDVKRLTRVCTDEDAASEHRASHCPWCILGFTARPRYLINVADYDDPDEAGDPKIKFVEFPKMAAEALTEWYRTNKEDCPDGPGDMVGPAPDFVVTVSGVAGKGMIKYEVVQKGNSKQLSQSVINAIKKINPNATTPEEQMKLHDLERLCHPTYMSSDMQMKMFGELIDDVPFAERKDDDEKPSYQAKAKKPVIEDDGDVAPAVKPSPAIDEEDEDDVDTIFNSPTLHKADEADDETPSKSANLEVKW